MEIGANSYLNSGVCIHSSSAVIGSKAGGMADMITHGETELLADPTDFKDFAAMAIQLLANPATCTQIGQAARASVVARYSPAALFLDYEKTHRAAIEHRRAAGPRPSPWIA